MLGALFLNPSHANTLRKKHSASVFGHSVTLNLAKGHPLYKKVTCSPDGYFLSKDGSIVLLEFKCPFKRKITMHRIPHHYTRQIQTGLAFSGEKVNKRLFVDAYFRMCTLKQLEPSLKHNEWLNCGNIYETKDTSVLAWRVCYLFSKQNLISKQTKIINIADGQASTFINIATAYFFTKTTLFSTTFLAMDWAFAKSVLFFFFAFRNKSVVKKRKESTNCTNF